MEPIQYINGVWHDFSSIEAKFGGQKIIGFTALNYDDTLEVGKVRGSARKKLGRTPGQADSTGSFNMLLREWQRLIKKLGDGFGRKRFDIIVVYSDPDIETITHTLIGCRITKVGSQRQQGTEPIMANNELDIADIDYGDGITLAGQLDTTGLASL